MSGLRATGVIALLFVIVGIWQISTDSVFVGLAFIVIALVWFRELTDKALRRGAFHSVPGDRSDRGLPRRPQLPAQALVWTATADSILEKVARCRVALQAVKQN